MSSLEALLAARITTGPVLQAEGLAPSPVETGVALESSCYPVWVGTRVDRDNTCASAGWRHQAFAASGAGITLGQGFS